jgi:hypothetical protein
MQKHRIYTDVGVDQKITVELKQDYDLLEILSLKFSQQEVYSSFCADYGVVCGRVTVNNGFGVPNAKVSIFVPITEIDKNDPVISKLYPYSFPTDKDDNNIRYNLLPSRKQHGGHVPVGTFPDQKDILNREEVLEVYEKYYKLTVKTNSAGDFMIWGVPLGEQTVHIDLDLSDMGCFSFRPYDFIRQGENPDIFDRFYNFKSETDLDGLPQIVSFTKTIEVYPFWGNQELCEIGITRVDYDLSSSGIKVEPISLVLISTATDNNSTAVKKSGVIRPRSGYKCKLETKEGSVEGVRFTTNKVLGSDGVTEYPKLEYFEPGTIDENGSCMVVTPMNMDYVYTNQFGEEEITNDPNKGIPTTTIARFRVGLDDGSGVGRKGTKTAYYLLPNIREFNPNNSSSNRGTAYSSDYSEGILSSYVFSDVFEDYINYPVPSGMTLSNQLSVQDKQYKKDLILGTFNDNIPEDYFYKFTYGKVYTSSSFQGSHYEVSSVESFFGLTRRDAFLGIKEIRPNVEDDCSSVANYIPTNFGFRNRIKFGLLISAIILFLNFIVTIIIVKLHEFVGRFLLIVGRALYNIYFGWPFRWRPFARIGEQFQDAAYNLQDRGTKVLSLVVYPDCEDCTEDIDNSSNDLNIESLYASIGEVKCKVFGIGANNSEVLLIPIDINVSTTTGSTFLLNTQYISDVGGTTTPAREYSATGATSGNTFSLTDITLATLHTYTIPPRPQDLNTQRFVSNVYPFIDDTILPFSGGPVPNYNNVRTTTFTEFTSAIGLPNDNLPNPIFFTKQNFPKTYRETPTTFPGSYLYKHLNWFDRNNNPAYYEPSTSLFTPNSYLTPWINQYGNLNYGTNNPIEVLCFRMSHNQWSSMSGMDYSQYGGELNGFGGLVDRGLYAIVKIYDRTVYKVDPATVERKEVQIEAGCEKYDKLYNENLSYNYIWGLPGAKYGNPHNSYGLLVESKTNPDSSQGYTIMSDISATAGTSRMPRLIAWSSLGTRYYDRRTKSGLSEVRDGVFTCVPVIEGRSNNIEFVKEWYRRKRIGQFFCGGVINYSNIDNWLNGLLYLFKFDYRIKWDNEDNFDLNQRGSKYPRELVFFDLFQKKFYYRSTPFDYENFTFMGQKPNSFSTYVELLRPTTIYDVGVRDEFFYEICQDPRLDPTCSVIREIDVTSYQDPANIVEHAINFKLDVTQAKADVKDFFLGTGYDFGKILNGDISQLMSINCEAGIEEFDLDSPKYFMFNGEFLDPEDPLYVTYFKDGGQWGPTPIDFKLDERGRFVRLCLNNRLGDFSQKVPFFLWDKKSEGFGGFGSNAYKQRFDRIGIAVQKLQRIVSLSSVNNTTTNYLMADGEEEYLLNPITKNHSTFNWLGNYTDMVERFDEISFNLPSNPTRYIEGDLWLQVTGGTISDPTGGNIYVIVNQNWVGPITYVKDSNELFIFETINNYSGQKIVLSTPFHFYFGLIPGKTSYDKFIKHYGPKGAFTPVE